MTTPNRKPHAPRHHPQWWTMERVQKMHARYVAGATFTEIARDYDVRPSSVRQAFVRRKLVLIPRPNFGRFARTYKLKTAAQVAAILARQTRLIVPRELAYDWRHWSMSRRGAFLRKLRAKLNDPRDAPRQPYSANVTPFDYASPEAREIIDQLNEGCNSREAGTKINLRSQGVIYEGKLWFWINEYGYIYRQPGPYLGPQSRLVLHRYLYEQTHGPLSAEVVRFADGNPNNLDPSNLIVASRDDVCRENQAEKLRQKAEAHTAALLRRMNQSPTPKGD
jgi:hypothetical protein